MGSKSTFLVLFLCFLSIEAHLKLPSSNVNPDMVHEMTNLLTRVQAVVKGQDELLTRASSETVSNAVAKVKNGFEEMFSRPSLETVGKYWKKKLLLSQSEEMIESTSLIQSQLALDGASCNIKLTEGVLVGTCPANLVLTSGQSCKPECADGYVKGAFTAFSCKHGILQTSVTCSVSKIGKIMVGQGIANFVMTMLVLGTTMCRSKYAACERVDTVRALVSLLVMAGFNAAVNVSIAEINLKNDGGFRAAIITFFVLGFIYMVLLAVQGTKVTDEVNSDKEKCKAWLASASTKEGFLAFYGEAPKNTLFAQAVLKEDPAPTFQEVCTQAKELLASDFHVHNTDACKPLRACFSDFVSEAEDGDREREENPRELSEFMHCFDRHHLLQLQQQSDSYKLLPVKRPPEVKFATGVAYPSAGQVAKYGLPPLPPLPKWRDANIADMENVRCCREVDTDCGRYKFHRRLQIEIAVVGVAFPAVSIFTGMLISFLT